MAESTNNYEFIGKVKFIQKNVDVISANFQKRIFVVVSEEQYPQMIMFELQQQKVSLISPFFEGDEVKVKFNIRGREWINPEGKALYFNSFIAWKIDKLSWRGAPGEEKPYVEPIQEGEDRNKYGMIFPKDAFDAPQIGNPRTVSNFPPNDDYSGYGYDGDHDDLPF